MKKRLAIVGASALLVALLVAPSSAKVKPNATEVNPKAGKWRGQTAQGFPIEFVVKKKPKAWKVVSASYEFTYECTGSLFGGPLPITTFTHKHSWPEPGYQQENNEFSPAYGQDGTRWFYAHYNSSEHPDVGKFTNHRLIKGRFRSKAKAKGVISDLRDEEDYAAGVDQVCKSGNVAWTAHR